MRRLGGLPSAVALLLLAALALPGVASLAHDHHAPVLVGNLAELPVYAAGHEQPDSSEHVEGAVLVDSADCSVCIQRQRKSTEAAQSPSPLGSVPSEAAAIGRDTRVVGGLANPTAAPRAPPLA